MAVMGQELSFQSQLRPLHLTGMNSSVPRFFSVQTLDFQQRWPWATCLECHGPDSGPADDQANSWEEGSGVSMSTSELGEESPLPGPKP